MLGLACFASTFSMRLVDPLVPTIAAEMNVSLTQAALLASFFTVAYALGQPFLGPVADSVGKTRVIALALVGLCVLTLIAAAMGQFEALAVVRALSGIAAGGVIPVAMAAVGDRVPFAERQVALSRLLMALVIGQVAGSTLSGAIGEVAGWRTSFVASALVAALGATITLMVLKPRPNAKRDPLDLASVLARYGAVLANPKAKVLYGLVAIEGMVVFAVFPYAAELLSGRGAVGSAEAGMALAVFGLGGLIYTLSARVLVRRLGPPRMAILGGLLLGTSLMLLSLPLPVITAPVFFGLLGLGFYLIHSSYQTQATELSSDFRSSAVALFACSLFLGTAMGPASVAVLRTLITLETALLVYAAGCVVLGFASRRLVSGGETTQRPR